MSATGQDLFKSAIYESDILQDGQTDLWYCFGLRIKPAVLLLSIGGVLNAQLTSPTGIIPFHAGIETGRRRFGIHARFINLSRVQGTNPTAFLIKRRVPILTRDIFDACLTAQFNSGTVVNYEDQSDWVIVSCQKERIV
jgi:hypothetical protein